MNLKKNAPKQTFLWFGPHSIRAEGNRSFYGCALARTLWAVLCLLDPLLLESK